MDLGWGGGLVGVGWEGHLAPLLPFAELGALAGVPAGMWCTYLNAEKACSSNHPSLCEE